MRNTTLRMLVLAATLMTAGPLWAQSANRTAAEKPRPPKEKHVVLASETPDVARCRLHCQTLPAVGPWHSVRDVAELRARESRCAKKMVLISSPATR